MSTLSYVTEEKDPSNQNVISESCLSDDARYLKKSCGRAHKATDNYTSQQ